MFNNIDNYKGLNLIINNVSKIEKEFLEAIKQDEVVRSIMYPTNSDLEHYTDYWVKDNGFHEDQTGYDIRKGEYSSLAIFKKDFSIKHFDVEKLFPETLLMLRGIEGAHFSGFFKMLPHTKLDAHTHNRSHLIFHLLLNDLKGGNYTLRCGNEIKTLKNKGDSMLFDYSVEHESENSSDSERIHFIIDFKPLK